MCDSLGQPYTKTTKETISGRTLHPTVAYPLIHRDRPPGKNAPQTRFYFSASSSVQSKYDSIRRRNSPSIPAELNLSHNPESAL